MFSIIPPSILSEWIVLTEISELSDSADSVFEDRSDVIRERSHVMDFVDQWNESLLEILEINY